VGGVVLGGTVVVGAVTGVRGAIVVVVVGNVVVDVVVVVVVVVVVGAAAHSNVTDPSPVRVPSARDTT